jgi:hypothetical protein
MTSPVAECSSLSALRNVTLPPTAIVVVDGWNARSAIVTMAVVLDVPTAPDSVPPPDAVPATIRPW